MIVRAAHPSHFGWLLSRIGLALSMGMRAIEAVSETGEILGMVGYDSWMPNSVAMHFALESPLAGRALCGPAFSYAFEEAGKGVVLGFIPAYRQRAVSIAKRLGFREVVRFRDGWEAGVDLVSLEMRREEWEQSTARRLSNGRRSDT